MTALYKTAPAGRSAASPSHRGGGRSVVMTTHGMVATSHPLAAQVGLDILKAGGNAVDAAIATNAAIGLMEPMSCGIGGDLFAIVWDAKAKALHGLDASGRSPYAATRAHFAALGLSDIPAFGPLSWSTPGCVGGWEALRQRFGTMRFAQLLEPSIAYAREGVPVPDVIAGYWRSAEARLGGNVETARVFLPGGQAPKSGEVFQNPALAKSYEEIASGGPGAFYHGRIAQEIVAFSERSSGLFSMRDFADNAPKWIDPVGTNYRGYDVWELPPPGQGIAALQMLNILEGYDIAALGQNSAEFWHLLVEAKKLAFADRARFYADPEFARVPVAELISKPYAVERRALIDPDSALVNVPAGDPKLGQSDTIYLCVVDQDRNCVSLIQSNYNGFGSGLAPEKAGFALQNRGTLFSLFPGHANTLEPHRRPFHTIIPAMVTHEGKPWLTFGVMGGDMQPQGHVQVLVNLIDFGMDIQSAGEAIRIEHVGSATPTGLPEQPGGGTVAIERGMPASVAEGLRKRGHTVVEAAVNGGGYQAILIDPATNVLHGASEARKDGAAAGY